MPLTKSELAMSDGQNGKEADLYAVAIIQAMRDPLVVLDRSLRVRFANRSFFDLFQPDPDQTLDRPFYELGNREWNRAPLLALLENLSPAKVGFDDHEVEHDFPKIGLRTMLLTGRWLFGDNAATSRVLVTIKDVTQLRAVDRKLKVSEVRYRRLFEAAHDGILILDTHTR